MRRRSMVYVAGPYMGEASHDYHGYFAIHANIARAHETSLELARLGYLFFCPHAHSAHNEVIAPDIPAEYWYELDNRLLLACDAMLVLPGKSKGVEVEIGAAECEGIPVYYALEDIVANVPIWRD